MCANTRTYTHTIPPPHPLTALRHTHKQDSFACREVWAPDLRYHQRLAGEGMRRVPMPRVIAPTAIKVPQRSLYTAAPPVLLLELRDPRNHFFFIAFENEQNLLCRS